MSTKINLRANPQSQLKQLKTTSNMNTSPRKASFFDSQNPQKTASISKNLMNSTVRQTIHMIPISQLKGILSQYKQLKQLSLNPITQTKQHLWRDSPCTVPFTSRHISFDKIQKFKIGSIYYKDDASQQKRVFTDYEKPELMLKNFRRQLEETSYSKNKYENKSSNLSNEKSKTKQKMRTTIPCSGNNFYHVPWKTELKYDRNGSRSAYQGEYNVKQIMNSLRQTKRNFTSGKRMDLALPLNFNPGPGKYFNNQESQQIACQTYRTRQARKTLQNFGQKSQRLNSTQFLPINNPRPNQFMGTTH